MESLSQELILITSKQNSQVLETVIWRNQYLPFLIPYQPDVYWKDRDKELYLHIFTTLFFSLNNELVVGCYDLKPQMFVTSYSNIIVRLDIEANAYISKEK